MMSYIDLINNFWREDDQQGFNGNETRLYFCLLHLANRLFWEKEWMICGDEKMRANLGISAEVLRTSRNHLKEVFLIDFIVGGHGHRDKTRYRILTPKLKPSSEPKVYAKPEPLYNKTKTNINVLKNQSYDRKKGFVFDGSDFNE